LWRSDRSLFSGSLRARRIAPLPNLSVMASRADPAVDGGARAEQVELLHFAALEVRQGDAEETDGVVDLRCVPERHRDIADELAVGRGARERLRTGEQWVNGLAHARVGT